MKEIFFYIVVCVIALFALTYFIWNKPWRKIKKFSYSGKICLNEHPEEKPIPKEKRDSANVLDWIGDHVGKCPECGFNTRVSIKGDGVFGAVCQNNSCRRPVVDSNGNYQWNNIEDTKAAAGWYFNTFKNLKCGACSRLLCVLWVPWSAASKKQEGYVVSCDRCFKLISIGDKNIFNTFQEAVDAGLHKAETIEIDTSCPICRAELSQGKDDRSSFIGCKQCGYVVRDSQLRRNPQYFNKISEVVKGNVNSFTVPCETCGTLAYAHPIRSGSWGFYCWRCDRFISIDGSSMWESSDKATAAIMKLKMKKE